ncbi:hypothetical protein [Pantoea agglomerans]|uniref:hypothetical protein n=1 Tax=Enterobacter agglomerans TaxID=549 RepID=UPI002786954D|nr:hypothetical protein [Pantoea agglomerans]MDQ0628062.1 hypothetical protein [Pantoea agglomerans]
MSESKVTDAAKDIAGKAFEKLQDSAAPLNTALMNRFGNPVFYSFLVSWALLNWERIVIIVAGTGELEKRIAVAKGLPSVFFGVEHATTYYIPFMSTLIIVFVSPYINYVVDMFHTPAFRKKYIHTANLEAEKYIADTSALTAKVAYSMEEERERLRIKADNIENQSRIEIANLNLDTARSELISLQEAAKTQDKVYKENMKLLESVSNSIDSEVEKLNSVRDEIVTNNDNLAKINDLIIEKQAFLDNLIKNGKSLSNSPQSSKMFEGLAGLAGLASLRNDSAHPAKNMTEALSIREHGFIDSANEAKDRDHNK